MSNVVEAAIKASGEGREWAVHFTPEKKLIGTISHIEGDAFRLISGSREIYFDASKVMYLVPR